MGIAEQLRADGWKDLDNGKFKDQYDYLFYETDKIRLEFTNNNLLIGCNDRYRDIIILESIPYENIKLIQQAINY